MSIDRPIEHVINRLKTDQPLRPDVTPGLRDLADKPESLSRIRRRLSRPAPAR